MDICSFTSYLQDNISVLEMLIDGYSHPGTVFLALVRPLLYIIKCLFALGL